MRSSTAELGTKPIGRLIFQYSLPSIIAMLVNAIYNVVDRVFIGQYVGEEALAGLTIAFPVMMIMFAFASLLGAGGTALMSIKLGQKDIKGASHVFGNTLGLGLIINMIIIVLMYFNLGSVLTLFGASPDILEHASDYMEIILLGFIFQMFSFTLNNSVRTEGNPVLPMAAMIAAAILNMILDYIFIGIIGLGVRGAAMATIIGQLVGLVILISFYARGKSHLKLTAADFIPEFSIAKQIFTIGFATFVGTLGNSVALTFVNRALGTYGGTAAITAMGAINSLFTLFIMPLFGLQQGLQPIMGYNHGAELKDRVQKALKIGITAGIIFSTLVFLLLQSFPETFISLFIDSGSSTMDTAVQGMRIFFLLLPVICINIIGIAYFQATAQGKTALWLSMLRQFICLIPLVTILPRFFGINGVWIATPLADGLSVSITLIVLVYKLRTHKDDKEKTLMLSDTPQKEMC